METIERLEIGDWVVKKSGKPFKSTLKIGVIACLTVNSYTKKVAAQMRDGSIVDLDKLERWTENAETV